jgi:hypothetical protein
MVSFSPSMDMWLKVSFGDRTIAKKKNGRI